MFKLNVSNELCFQCLPMQHAVGIWKDKKDLIFACNLEKIFAVNVLNGQTRELASRENFLAHEYPSWCRLLPFLQQNVVTSSDCSYQLCLDNNGKYFLSNSDFKFLFFPKSHAFKIEGLLGAAFLSCATRVALLFNDKILITRCLDWWSAQELHVESELENKQQYTKLQSMRQRCVAYDATKMCVLDKEKILWQKTFEQEIQLVWCFGYGFQIAILFKNGEITLLDEISGHQLIKNSPPPIKVGENLHVVMKNSIRDIGTDFFIVSQGSPSENGLCQTSIRVISVERDEVDFISPVEKQQIHVAQ